MNYRRLIRDIDAFLNESSKRTKRIREQKEYLDFTKYEELAKNMTVAELRWAIKDAHEAAKAMETIDKSEPFEDGYTRSGKYWDEIGVYYKELRRRGISV